ncbi:hypothetical protein EsH8_X_000103 [Colletotrichum jinshuiense]
MRTRAALSTATAGSPKPTKRKHVDSNDLESGNLPIAKAPRQTRARHKTLRASSSSPKAKLDVESIKAEKPTHISSSPEPTIQTEPDVKTEGFQKPIVSTLSDTKLVDRKWKAWSKHANSSPYPDFPRPTPEECQTAHDIMERLHGDQVRQNFADPDAPSQDYPYVMDALVVAALSQATSWSNAKRAMKSMKVVYGSPFNYNEIVEGGTEKLVGALRPGGMQNRKAKILLRLLHDVKERHGKWDLQFLFNATDEEAVKEVVSYWGLGPKCAFCLLSICLKRETFAVDTHIYRITGLWGWRPQGASRELSQAHLDARIPNEIKYALHYQFIVHGRECPACRGNGNPKARCEYKEALKSIGNPNVT